MSVAILEEPFQIHQCTADPQHKDLHGHTFFELLFIENGTGIQYLNQNRIAYKAQDIFFITPKDKHSFDVTTDSRFTSIRFSKIYFKGSRANTDYGQWFKQLEYIFYKMQDNPEQIIKCDVERDFVNRLMNDIIYEFKLGGKFASKIIRGLIFTLLNVIARNIHQNETTINYVSNNSKITEIIDYIQLHIYEPERLRRKQISERFNISSNYISEYFKKFTGTSLNQYIQRYRIKLAETKLKFTDLNITEIARELNFVDEKHLNKAFQKFNDVSPSDFRNLYFSRLSSVEN